MIFCSYYHLVTNFSIIFSIIERLEGIDDKTIEKSASSLAGGVANVLLTE